MTDRLAQIQAPIPAAAVEAACACGEQFGQLIHDVECPKHDRCSSTMRGVPIRCILVSGHKGSHK
jgi:hypothetical protein